MNEPELLEIAVLLRRAQLGKQLACDAALARWDMTLPQWGMLHAVDSEPDLSTHRLGSITGQSDQAAGAVVARLQQRQLVERRQGPGKAILHRITVDGSTLLRLCDGAVAEVMRATLDGFSQAELATLRGQLTRLAGSA